MFSVDDYRWLGTQQAEASWEELLAGGLSRALPRQLKELLQDQLFLCRMAKAKFPDPTRWYWTRTLLQQASDSWCAAETAKDFGVGARVVDICCGAGADSLALSERGCDISAIDQSEIACALTSINAQRHGLQMRTIVSPAEDLSVSNDSYVHVDPDRRASGHRVSAVQGFQPSWELIHQWKEKVRGISIKLAPATGVIEQSDAPETIRFLSRDRSVRQQRWLWGLDRWPRESVVVSVLHQNQWVHEVFEQNMATCDDHGVDEGMVQRFVADYDPVIRAARVSDPFRRRINCGMLDRLGGYLSSDRPVAHPMLRWFRVLEILPFDQKRLRAYAREVSCGQWEIKTRGIKVDVDKLHQQLPIDKSSELRRTLLIGNVAARPKAIIAEPLGGWGECNSG
jgi:SAM-dependent methyltransferase